MESKKAPSPFAVLWGWADGEHGGFYTSVALALMVPYFCVAAMIARLLSGGGLVECMPWCAGALVGYLGKALFSTWSTALSHTATYHILRKVRRELLAKLSRVPMGTILDTPSGQYKTTIVDRVEGMEPTLAHLLPEMTSNLLVPLAIAVYIFVLDWRMGLASLVTTVVGMLVSMQSAKNYGPRWQGAVEVGRRMANAIVEYVGGIQVIKAFGQGSKSFGEFSRSVNFFHDSTLAWWRQSWFWMAGFKAVLRCPWERGSICRARWSCPCSWPASSSPSALWPGSSNSALPWGSFPTWLPTWTPFRTSSTRRSSAGLKSR